MSEALLVVNAIALAAALVALLVLACPPGRAVCVRNAFLLRRGRPEDFRWTPAAVPTDYRVEREDPPRVIAEAVVAGGIPDIADDWLRARALVGLLVRHARHEGGIRADIATTYRRIVEGYGYCVDFVRVYMAAARRADLFCRQWAFSFDGFGGHGHTFVEVFDRQRGAWVFLDVHNNVYATVGGRDEPVDALVLHAALRTAPASVAFHRAGEGRLGWPVPGKLLAYYVRGVDHWCLWWGNDVIGRERRGLAGALGKLSGSLAHRIGGAFGALPALIAMPLPENASSIDRMQRLRRQVLAAGTLSGALAVTLSLQLAMRWLAHRGP